jgi:hypothetical protein
MNPKDKLPPRDYRKQVTGDIIQTRWVGEQHVREDLGFIHSFADWVKAIRPEPWMGRAQPLERTVLSIAAGGSRG